MKILCAIVHIKGQNKTKKKTKNKQPSVLREVNSLSKTKESTGTFKIILPIVINAFDKKIQMSAYISSVLHVQVIFSVH